MQGEGHHLELADTVEAKIEWRTWKMLYCILDLEKVTIDEAFMDASCSASDLTFEDSRRPAPVCD